MSAAKDISYSSKALATPESQVPPAPQEKVALDLSGLDPDFIERFFVPLESASNIEEICATVTPLVQELLEANVEQDMSVKVTEIFDKIAQLLQAGLGGHKSFQYLLQFKPSTVYKAPLEKHPSNDGFFSPEIVILPPQDYAGRFVKAEEIQDSVSSGDVLRVHYPENIMLGVIGVKLDSDWDKQKIVAQLDLVLGYRPDAINVLGMACNKTGFQFYYLDTCNDKISQVFSWDKDLDNLVAFTYSLHRRYAEDIGRDTTMQLLEVKWSDTNALTDRWLQTVFEGKNYRVRPIFQGAGSGRTWVAIGTEILGDEMKPTSKFRVVKDQWRDNSRKYEEARILARIHKKGYIPGVVRLIGGGPLSYTTGKRTRYRLMMGSTGLRLSACKSVLEFLKIVYDAIEAHEKLMERGVLHQDVSWYNLLCHPEHHIGEPGEEVDHPNIGKVLGEPDPHSLCLLTDFDSAAVIDSGKGETKLTGTDMFMACELAYGGAGYRSLRFRLSTIGLHQYILKYDILKKYTSVYGRKRYDQFNRFLSSILAGDLKEVNPFSDCTSLPPHQAHHDIESMYWIIIWFLAKTWPEGQNPYLGEDMSFQTWLVAQISNRRSLGHHMTPVLTILKQVEKEWEAALHPEFRSLAKMLSDMGDYICMGWSKFPDLSHCDCWWHSHEAFKRLLLKEIVRMTNDNDPLPIQGPRPSLYNVSKDGAVVAEWNSAKSKRSTSPSDILPSSLVRRCVDNMEDDADWFDEM